MPELEDARPHTARRVLVRTVSQFVKHFLGQPDHPIYLQSSMWLKGDCIYQEMLMIWVDNWSKFGKKYRRRPSQSALSLYATSCGSLHPD
ncbi:hypothetical protein TNCV_2856171 [Trichonephila clavipes]|nr:hypothetical protein TNCV_2856171 [Trichonephila clavipes]